MCLNIEITDTHSSFLFACVNKLSPKKLLNIEIKFLTECRAMSLLILTIYYCNLVCLLSFVDSNVCSIFKNHISQYENFFFHS
jgi:hypothetical protein